MRGPSGSSQVLACFACAAVSGGALAQAPRLGSEFQVNSYTPGRQERSSVASDADGDFVVVWESFAQDGNQDGVFAQRFGATGIRQGVEFQVNAYTTASSPTLGIQDQPDVAGDADGDFVVVWRSFSQDGNSYGVFARRYDSAGAATGAEFQVNSYTTGVQGSPTVAMADDGRFVAVWQSSQDGNGAGIFARRFDSLGAPQGVELQVNTYTSNTQDAPAIALGAAGDFTIAWTSTFQEGEPSPGIFAQRFDSLGVPIASEFHVNTYTPGNQDDSALAIAADGRFMVVWQSAGGDGGANGVIARRFDSSGSAEGADFQVNTFTIGNQYQPGIEVDTHGEFVVVWTSAQDGNGFGIFAQRFDSAGARLGVEFRVNTYTTQSQNVPAVAMDDEGGFVVVWDSLEQDGDFEGIFAQLFGAEFAPLDVDADGAFLPLTDGRIVLHYAFGFTGTALTAGVVGPACTRCGPTEIDAYLDSIVGQLDVDGNGLLEPLADGLLIVRYGFNFVGSTLTAGAVGELCTLCDADAIVPYLDQLDG